MRIYIKLGSTEEDVSLKAHHHQTWPLIVS